MSSAKKVKLSVLLATTDQLASQFKTGVAEAGKFFKNNQVAFRGHKKTYEAVPDTVDDPTKRSLQLVVTTVGEKLQWMKETSETYINALFSQEATNASGAAKAELKVGDISFGVYSSLELMRLKSILDTEGFQNMYAQIPVREETKAWSKSTEETYTGREIYEDKMVEGEARTTDKIGYILEDPNVLAGKVQNYSPKIEYKTNVVKVGDTTSQNFSGEISHRERAIKLRRLTELKTAVLAALKEANDAEVVQSDMTASKLFDFIDNGAI